MVVVRFAYTSVYVSGVNSDEKIHLSHTSLSLYTCAEFNVVRGRYFVSCLLLFQGLFLVIRSIYAYHFSIYVYIMISDYETQCTLGHV